jgi:hypothetical protein
VNDLTERIIPIKQPIDIAVKEKIIDTGSVIINLDTNEFTLKTGGKLPFWELNKKEIGDFITNSKIAALPIEKQKEWTKTVTVVPETINGKIIIDRIPPLQRVPKIPPYIIPGIPIPDFRESIPHIHYEGNIYQLTDTQWNSFANVAVAKLGSRLATAKNISFDKFIATSEIVEELI